MTDESAPQADQPQGTEHLPSQYPQPEHPASQYPASQYPQPEFTFVPQPPMPIKNHLGWAIAGLLLFWPLGIPALVKCVEVAPLWYQGDYRGAEDSSRAAKSWGKAGVIAGAVLYGLLIVLMIVYVVFIFFLFSRMQQELPR